MGVGETITVINKSGKVVSSSKHIVSVFKEAKAAYRERKAEIKAEKEAAYQLKKLNEGVKAVRIDDDVQSRASSHRSKKTTATRSKSHKPSSRVRPGIERGYTDSFYANDSPRTSKHRFEDDLAGNAQDAHRMEIVRRNSDQAVQKSSRPEPRRKSEGYIDMDLAYGDIPPPLPAKKYDDGELKEKASKITMLLDEANCLQYSVTQTIENLQKNPEALAAVSLTLAEISAIVGKMGPGVLLTLKGSFPAVAALLLSPQFMIAGGVAVGVTIVALGGYKIIKKIQADSAEKVAAPVEIPMAPMRARVDSGADLDQLDELEPAELSRVELWRRGIADVEAQSVGTSIDGEFVTPGASRQLIAAGVLDEDDLKSRRSARSRVSRADSERRPKSTHKAKSEKSVKTTKTSDTRRSKTVKETSTKKKEKEPSGLKMLFRAHTHA
ncbi:hypothetical protein HBI56_056220 [Parastagonospora nodorum]|uniref:Uncharacterized protein n=1 Tax=Phaeosphaeria nodorum (strain SN15 / ATCC MYA-4574 / FGSC 10173) TaxID=321614 RepID=A0A7U2ICF3_PHANO|nr:hypothetical protein HBH56_095890 [Parastagonospora nodorum]QRD07195.1 hypothetical protein JI435_123960 [Parastagonospora nodorum SN15]KAH3930399.1 hypothetical protein HBH54_110210 [Parastagonospora nodorum]KAH3944966.1 hypothetical protein HBH53_149230 [Parastagonospora nodorum]KAH3967019.1 hypothetical protein HBH51_140630 [Parastagonospora nodorum]